MAGWPARTLQLPCPPPAGERRRCMRIQCQPVRFSQPAEL